MVFYYRNVPNLEKEKGRGASGKEGLSEILQNDKFSITSYPLPHNFLRGSSNP